MVINPFKTLGELDEHIKLKHNGPTQAMQFNCEECDLLFTSQHYLRLHVAKKHASACHNATSSNCDNCGIVFRNNGELKRHMEECIGAFQQVEGQKCRYYRRGRCWRGDQCRFVHDDVENFEEENIPECRNGPQCGYLANGVCRFFHSSSGAQKPGSKWQSPPHNQGYQRMNRHPQQQKWCKYLEDCIRVPNCTFKHTEEDFPQLPKTNHQPIWQRMSSWEDY